MGSIACPENLPVGPSSGRSLRHPVDLKAAQGGAGFMLVAGQADSLALAGVKSKDLAEARSAAKGVGALLAVVADNLK
jgi:hypothetical protein